MTPLQWGTMGPWLHHAPLLSESPTVKRNVFTKQPQHGCRFNCLLYLQPCGAGSTGREFAGLDSPQMAPKKKKKKTAEEICRSLQDRFFLGFYGMPCLISITCGPRASATIMSEYTAYISHPQHKCLWHFIRPTQMASWFADLFTNYS